MLCDKGEITFIYEHSISRPTQWGQEKKTLSELILQTSFELILKTSSELSELILRRPLWVNLFLPKRAADGLRQLHSQVSQAQAEQAEQAEARVSQIQAQWAAAQTLQAQAQLVAAQVSRVPTQRAEVQTSSVARRPAWAFCTAI